MNCSGGEPVTVASHAALSCYEDKKPEWGKEINIEKAVFNTGHHTTLQHYFYTFFIEGVSVGDVTFGLHLANPFYDTSQRSGRFCAAMFSNPDHQGMEDYIKRFWPKFKGLSFAAVQGYITYALQVYNNNLKKAVNLTDGFIQKERPHANEKYRTTNSPKIAQEQMRVFIPVIFPTGMEYTINLSTLVAMYRSAWSPVMKEVTEQMKNLVIQRTPDLSFMFEREDKEDSSVSMFEGESLKRITYKPDLILIGITGEESFVKPDPKDLHPVDLLHFLPNYMPNNVGEIRTEISLSVATMGQDQRHRTIRRGKPVFTGEFYLPPVPTALCLESEARKVYDMWLYLRGSIPDSLHTVLAPYGAVVAYRKTTSFNAGIHEQGKRLCWCAQEEIYHLSRLLQQELDIDSPLQGMFSTSCVVSGKCGEGNRCCGRSMSMMKKCPFPERRV
ncbi:FAD-dependent thymidylate synthase [Patescibacteria group bacterium]|nr:FAD-dependent thymidylate synthase [Patescibacteria group bacterium]